MQVAHASSVLAGPRFAPASTRARVAVRQPLRSALHISCMAAKLEFVEGIEEPTIPNVRLTRSRDGSSGVATFTFESPAVFEASAASGDITGLYLIDDEGTLQTVEVQATFVNGKPSAIVAKHIMRSSMEWDRFMRWMERYAEEKGLGFTKA